MIELARATERPQDVIGMHFFNPAPVMKLVEVVSTVMTDDDVTETTRALCDKIGKVGVSCADRAGFIVNALLFPYLNDAVKMLEAHYATADDIDTAMKQGCALPMGPFELLDVVGNDVSLAIQRELYLEFREPGFAPAPLLEHLVTAGYLGRKTKRGFRDYSTPLTSRGRGLRAAEPATGARWSRRPWTDHRATALAVLLRRTRAARGLLARALPAGRSGRAAPASDRPRSRVPAHARVVPDPAAGRPQGGGAHAAVLAQRRGRRPGRRRRLLRAADQGRGQGDHRRLRGHGPPHPYRINNGFWVLLFGRQLPDSNLAIGAHGPVVKVLQRALRAAGATVVVDGNFGTQTEAAVKRYQKAHRVKQTGVVDENTRFFLGQGGVIGQLS